MNLWRTHGGGIVQRPFPKLLVDDENLGPMPSLEEMMQMRGVNGDNDAYVFMFEVFGGSVYGDGMVRDITNQDITANTPEAQKQAIWKEAMSKFTTSDEAFILLALEDSWDAWALRSRQDFKQKLYKEDPAWCQAHQINEDIDTDGVEQYKYSGCAHKKGRGMSDIGLDRLDELQQNLRDDREYVSVDGLFQRQNVFMENLLKKHRERMGYVNSADQDQPQQKKRRKHGLWFF